MVSEDSTSRVMVLPVTAGRARIGKTRCQREVDALETRRTPVGRGISPDLKDEPAKNVKRKVGCRGPETGDDARVARGRTRACVSKGSLTGLHEDLHGCVGYVLRAGRWRVLPGAARTLNFVAKPVEREPREPISDKTPSNSRVGLARAIVQFVGPGFSGARRGLARSSGPRARRGAHARRLRGGERLGARRTRVDRARHRRATRRALARTHHAVPAQAHTGQSPGCFVNIAASAPTMTPRKSAVRMRASVAADPTAAFPRVLSGVAILR